MSQIADKTYAPSQPHNVAFLGLGVMGYPMAGHLAHLPATDGPKDLTQQLICQQHCLFGFDDGGLDIQRKACFIITLRAVNDCL